ncbi:MAG: Holliday junction resolvase RuvX [Actinomycetaceae bacterium]|nr:Holliday junction resolvase RuvX [Actinomycetaceae bacterium]
MRPGTRLALDIGKVRIGVARSDIDGIMALPVKTIHRSNDGQDFQEVLELVQEYDPIEVIVGLPRHMSGHEGGSAAMARAYGTKLARRIHPIEVRLVDERLTTVSAHAQLHESGRSTRQHRQVVDQVAATVILEHALEIERRLGEAAGTKLVVKGS